MWKFTECRFIVPCCSKAKSISFKPMYLKLTVYCFVNISLSSKRNCQHPFRFVLVILKIYKSRNNTNALHNFVKISIMGTSKVIGTAFSFNVLFDLISYLVLANHFRGGTISWKYIGPGNRVVKFIL